MKEIEITDIPPLSPGELSLLDLHSVLNTLNVLRSQLAMLGFLAADREDYFHEGLVVCDALVRSVHDPVTALREAARIDEYERVVFAELAAKLVSPPAQPDPEELADAMANLRAVFEILKVRAQEILARAAAPDRWQIFNLPQLRADFMAAFAAIERHSRGRYHILFNAARTEPQDYYIDFKLETAAGAPLMMPAVFTDVMRDLIANARKYTPPGGNILAALYEDAAALRFVVADTGRGIPEDEIEPVVHFGKRASSVGDVRTLGGGFGLTKAFLVTKRFGGRFWIASEVGHGTRIRITIPQPVRSV